MKPHTVMHFIINTHLDREWTMDFHHTRQLTVEFIDALLDIMKKVPEYRFLMDAQAVPLEDYLEIRPEKRAVLKRLVRQGRIDAGPWYTALDMNCLSGETVARNILMGHLVAEKFGRVMKVGYTPFGWGQVAQLPQIYGEFGIDVIYFYRGITEKQVPRSEFIWEGSDGTRALGSRFGPGNRSSFYFMVWRPAMFSDKPKKIDRDYDWRYAEKPFKLCGEKVKDEHGSMLSSEKNVKLPQLRKYFRRLIDAYRKTCTTPHFSFTHGQDTSMPSILDDKALKMCQKFLKPGEKFFYSSLPEYSKCLKKDIDPGKLKVLRGENKHFNPWTGGSLGVANDIISCRSRQKALNTEAGNLLERSAEPFAAAAMMLGHPWPAEYLTLAWKTYLKCHPHDTIGGCSIDRVEEEATNRLKDVISLGNLVLKQSLGRIQKDINTSAMKNTDIMVTVFNPSPARRSECAGAYIDIPRELGKGEFSLLDPSGRAVPFRKRATGGRGRIYRDKTDLVLYSNSDEYAVDFMAEDLPPLGYRTYILRRGRKALKGRNISPAPGVLENGLLKVRVNRNGTFDLEDRKNGGKFSGLHYFEDAGEAGHAWTHCQPRNSKPLHSRGLKAKVSRADNSPLSATLRVEVTMMIPETTYFPANPVKEPGRVRRSSVKKPLKIVSLIKLRKNAGAVEIKTSFDNRCRNHRLRAMFPTGIRADNACAENVFDVMERRIAADKLNPYGYLPYQTFNFLKFVDISDGKSGFAFISSGLKEYEAADDRQRTLAVTLMRACAVRMCTTSYEKLDERPGDLSQCFGENTFTYSILPHTGGWQDPAVYREAERLNYPLAVSQSGKGGGGKLPREMSFLELEGNGLVLSAVKKSDRDDSLIVRVFNPTGGTVAGKITFPAGVVSARAVTLNEKPARNRKASAAGNAVKLVVPAKKIYTVSVKFRGMAMK